jgi:hypothetical protein
MKRLKIAAPTSKLIIVDVAVDIASALVESSRSADGVLVRAILWLETMDA